MFDFMMFWLTKPLIEGIIILTIIAVWFLIEVPVLFRQARCKHNGSVRETSACDAICNDCGKNLGFIDTWRKQQAGKEEK